MLQLYYTPHLVRMSASIDVSPDKMELTAVKLDYQLVARNHSARKSHLLPLRTASTQSRIEHSAIGRLESRGRSAAKMDFWQCCRAPPMISTIQCLDVRAVSPFFQAYKNLIDQLRRKILPEKGWKLCAIFVDGLERLQPSFIRKLLCGADILVAKHIAMQCLADRANASRTRTSYLAPSIAGRRLWRALLLEVYHLSMLLFLPVLRPAGLAAAFPPSKASCSGSLSSVMSYLL